MLSLLGNGLLIALSPGVFPFLFMGVAGGIIVGALPGLTATMGVAVLLPLTFGMDATRALVMLTGIYIGGIYGGSVSAILLKTPGTPSAAATVLDGYEMAKKGDAAKALSIATVASFFGGTFSTIMLVSVAPVLANFALKFAAPEYFALAVFGISMVASISGKHVLKGLIAGVFGLLISTIGMDPVTSYPRFTMGTVNLYNGFSLISVLIGLFALAEAFTQMEQIFKPSYEIRADFRRGIVRFGELVRLLPVMIKSSIIGTIIGAIPATGGGMAAFLCYNEAKRSSKTPEQFGTGCAEGIAAPEAGNNGVTGGAMVPLLTLGVPGDSVTAILLGALIIQGLQPGPLLFTSNPEFVYGLFASMFVGNAIMLILGLFCAKLFCRILEVPVKFIIPAIITFSIVGAYALNNSIFDVWTCLGFGIIGYLMQKVEIPAPPVVLAVILGMMAESNLRRSLMLYRGSYSFFWTRPITVVFLLLAVFSLYSGIKRGMRDQSS